MAGMGEGFVGIADLFDNQAGGNGEVLSLRLVVVSSDRIRD